MWALDKIQKDVFYEALTEVAAQRVPKEKFLNFIKKMELNRF